MKINYILAIIIIVLIGSCVSKTPTHTIEIKLNDTGRVFEGVGGVSAGASSELLVDYPEPYRSDILDYLFKPNFGASLQHLKVEIGADAVVVGAEASHARNMDELLNPKEEYYKRGYEYWLMKEAQIRNPEILFCALEWAIPAYLGGHWTEENAKYIIEFIKGAKKYWGIDMQYISPGKNESRISPEWLKEVFKPMMIKEGLGDVKILGPDNLGYYWETCDQMVDDPELAEVIDAVGYHYVCKHLPDMSHEEFAATENAKNCGASLWASEDWSMHDGSWKNAHILTGIFNKFYIRDRITALQIWCPVDSYYDNTGEWKSTGLMKADQPWSGYYEVSPAIWATAHITQFIEPGWRFLDNACGYFDQPSGGNFVTLTDPEKKDFSIIIYADSLQRNISIKVPENQNGKDLHVWHSNEQEQFVYQGTIKPTDGIAEINLEANSIYSITTTTGQQKGLAKHEVPEIAEFPIAYEENFNAVDTGKNPRYFADIDGGFEVVGSNGRKVLEQQITENPIEWTFYEAFKPHDGPMTMLGDLSWTNYGASVDVQLPENGLEHARLLIRMDNSHSYLKGYTLKILSNGNWELLQQGRMILASGKIEIPKDRWVNLKLEAKGEVISAFIQDEMLKTIKNKYEKKGMIGLGCSWSKVKFDNLKIYPLK